MLAAAPLIASLALFQEAGIERLREKSIQLTGFLEFLVERLGPDARFITPREIERAGLSDLHPDLGLTQPGPQGL